MSPGINKAACAYPCGMGRPFLRGKGSLNVIRRAACPTDELGKPFVGDGVRDVPSARSAAVRLSKKPVIASQCSHWRGNPFLKRTNPALFAGFCPKRYGFLRRFAPRSKCPWGTPRNDRGGVYRHAEKKNALRGVLFLCMCVYLLRYSSIDLAPSLPAPMARMTVAAPVTASPPAYTA